MWSKRCIRESKPQAGESGVAGRPCRKFGRCLLQEAFSHPPCSCLCLVTQTLLLGPSDRELLENKGWILLLLSLVLSSPCPAEGLACAGWIRRT